MESENKEINGETSDESKTKKSDEKQSIRKNNVDGESKKESSIIEYNEIEKGEENRK